MTSPAPTVANPFSRRVPQVDGLRALGMLMVYGFHVWEFGGAPSWSVSLLGRQTNLLGFLRNFGTGVDLFMVISGFCLFWPLCKSTKALESWNCRDYLGHRARRIVPPYYAAIGYAIILPMILVAIFHALKITANWQPVPSAWQLFTHFLFIHSMFPQTWNGITGAFWSLGLEAQFYVLFPLAVFGYRRIGVKVIWAMIIASVFIRILGDTFITSFDWRFILSISALGRWMEFGYGMLTALAVARYWREGKEQSALAGTAQVIAALLLYIVAIHWAAPRPSSHVPVYEMMLSAGFALLTFALCTSRTPIARIFGSRLATWLGSISYSIYLIHQPTAWYLSEFFKKKLHVSGPADLLLLVTVGIVIVVVAAYLFYLLFEKPTMGWRPRKTAGAVPPAPGSPPEPTEPALNIPSRS